MTHTLDNLSKSIEEFVEMGIKLLLWDGHKRAGGEDEDIVVLLFLRNILDLADSISLQVKNSAIAPCKPLLRTIIETTFGLEYLLEKNTRKRSLAFIVWNTHKRLKFYERLDQTNQNGKNFRKTLEKDFIYKDGGVERHFENMNALEAKKNDEDLLKLPKYAKVEEEYQNTLKKTKKINWYTLYDGPRDIEQLAKRLNHHASYEISYRGLSDSVHGTNIFFNNLIKMDNGNVDIAHLRNPADAEQVTRDTLCYMLMAFNKFLSLRVPERKVEYGKWYFSVRGFYQSLISQQ